MSDRELLEKAAKAAGLKLDKSLHNGGGLDNTGFDVDGNAVLDWHNGVRWNPLTDDGDALRLAVRLCIRIYPPEPHLNTGDRASTNVFGRGWFGAEVEAHDAQAATRRAIVRAAAALAEGS